jgi:hypothetical protein
VRVSVSAKTGVVATSIAHNIETEKVGSNRHIRHPLHDARVTRSPRPANVAEERLHGLDSALHIDEDRAFGPVRNATDHTASPGRLCYSRPVVYSLDASVRETVPVYERVHGPARPYLSKSLSRSEPKWIPSFYGVVATTTRAAFTRARSMGSLRSANRSSASHESSGRPLVVSNTQNLRVGVAISSAFSSGLRNRTHDSNRVREWFLIRGCGYDRGVRPRGRIRRPRNSQVLGNAWGDPEPIPDLPGQRFPLAREEVDADAAVDASNVSALPADDLRRDQSAQDLGDGTLRHRERLRQPFLGGFLASVSVLSRGTDPAELNDQTEGETDLLAVRSRQPGLDQRGGFPRRHRKRALRRHDGAGARVHHGRRGRGSHHYRGRVGGSLGSEIAFRISRTSAAPSL